MGQVTPEEIAAKFSDTWMCGCGEADCPSIERLAAAIRVAVEEEREACALIVHDSDGMTFAEVEAAIRARGKA
jgi:hypothetical protein